MKQFAIRDTLWIAVLLAGGGPSLAHAQAPPTNGPPKKWDGQAAARIVAILLRARDNGARTR